MDGNSSNLLAAIETLKLDFHFPGHILPGTAFIIMGVWWICNTFKIHYDNERRNTDQLLHLAFDNGQIQMQETSIPFCATYNGSIPGFWCSEGFYKIMYASFDLFCHLLVVFYGGEMTNENQHMTVYVLFILNGIVDVVYHIKICKMPEGSDYLVSSATWTGLGFLFLSHKHAKTPIQIYYHSTLGWLALAVAFVTLLQHKYDKNMLTAVVRGIFCIIVGTWLYQIALSFHNPFVAENQRRNQVHLTNYSKLASITQTPSAHHHYQHNAESDDSHIVIMEIMNAATILTWHFILVSVSVVFLGIATFTKSLKENRGYMRLPSCCV